ncbi:uncharacterized protein LOC117902903 [Drosophila subobscura]|uniref:uncharacterized protein LOC117902903 n=1 Tax=Drosophila subobscura TaxID=7241 RepID=UPI00155B3336|nr:uncharacterized protein LOC117902903 [Drosophila subobscura]XP_034670352.1 uncharacterized protein LOC117902903 [Drosophila subobscura]
MTTIKRLLVRPPAGKYLCRAARWCGLGCCCCCCCCCWLLVGFSAVDLFLFYLFQIYLLVAASSMWIWMLLLLLLDAVWLLCRGCVVAKDWMLLLIAASVCRPLAGK